MDLVASTVIAACIALQQSDHSVYNDSNDNFC
jgi:hypothetical protein